MSNRHSNSESAERRCGGRAFHSPDWHRAPLSKHSPSSRSAGPFPLAGTDTRVGLCEVSPTGINRASRAMLRHCRSQLDSEEIRVCWVRRFRAFTCAGQSLRSSSTDIALSHCVARAVWILSAHGAGNDNHCDAAEPKVSNFMCHI